MIIKNNIMTKNICHIAKIKTSHSGEIDFNSEMFFSIVNTTDCKYLLLPLRNSDITYNYRAIERMIQVADDTECTMLYFDYYKSGKKIPLIDIQNGSLRNDFDFGAVVLLKTDNIRDILHEINKDLKYSAFYALRLLLMNEDKIFHLREYLYNEEERSGKNNEEKHFEYQKDEMQIKQKEYETVCTEYLKKTNAYISPFNNPLIYSKKDFPVTASVIISVYNRKKTIADAISSVRKCVV